MKTDTAIIQPVKTARTPVLGPVAVMVSPAGLLTQFRQALILNDHPGYPLYHSRLYYSVDQPDSVALVGPMMGAPYAAAILEALIAWGARRIIFAGWCGAIDMSVEIGDLLVPNMALSGEGTSGHYFDQEKGLYPASSSLAEPLKGVLSSGGTVHCGTVWTTDALYRETEAVISGLQQKGVLAVEMELAALFAVAQFHHIDLAGVLTVSDHLGDFTWRTGFKTPAFKKTNRHIAHTVSQWASNHAAETGNQQKRS